MHALTLVAGIDLPGTVLLTPETLGVGVVYCVPPKALGVWAQLFRYAAPLAPVWLVDQGAYEATAYGAAITSYVCNWYMFAYHLNQKIIVITPLQETAPSIEGLFRNARWLERETAEMFMLFFTGKRDRRALFLVGILFWGVLRKSYPVEGFYQLVTSPQTGQLSAEHQTGGA